MATEMKSDLQQLVDPAASFDSSAAGRPRARQRGMRRLGWSLLLVLAVAVVMQLRWAWSGSNAWQLLGQKGGVTVYSMKSPGYDDMKFRAVTVVHARLNDIVAALEDPELGKYAGFKQIRMIDYQDPQHFVSSSVTMMPFFFKPRQYVEEVNLWQDAASKQIQLTVTSAADRVAPDPCCVRVSRLNDRWLFTPLPGGNVRLDLTIDADLGGMVPYVLYNMGTPAFLFQVVPILRAAFESPKYRGIRYGFVSEAGQER